MTNVKLKITYDGSSFYGWQKTKAGPSIEQILQNAIETIFQHPIILQAASRTDRGVHAHGQVVNFFTEISTLKYEKIQFRLNSLLPKEIRVLEVTSASNDFHPTLDVLEKTYIYTISATNFQMPHERHYAWHVYAPLDLELMQKAALQLLGTHNFKGFSNHKSDEIYQDHIRHVEEISLLKKEHLLFIRIRGNHFLYKMIRTMVGTLIYIGCKKLPISVINCLMIKKSRMFAGITAPAHGLTLFNLKY